MSSAPTRIVLGTGVFFIAAALGVVILAYGPGIYGGWRERRLLHHASDMLAQQNFGGAAQAAQEVLRSHADSLPALYVVAEASEKENSPESVTWRTQIARLQPQNLDSQLNLASAALRFGQLDLARTTLEQVKPADRDRAAYHVVAGWLARAQGSEAEVEEHFAAAVNQEPGNDLYQFNLAVLRMRSDSREKVDEARLVLERLSKVPEFRAGSLRALLGEALQRNEHGRADSLAQDLQMSQQVTFADYLLCLEFYRKLDQSKFSALLEKVKPVAARNPTDAARLMEWLNKNGLAADVLKWAEKLPTELTKNPPPAIAIAEAFIDGKNWSRLKRWTHGGVWGDSEYLRLAYQAYGSKQSRQADAEYSSLWHSAELAAADRPDRELHLARLAAKWNFSTEAEQLWLRVSQNAPARREALEALFQIYRSKNDLPNLYRTSLRLHESSPNEPGVAADYARLALLLDQNAEEGHRVAREAYERTPAEVNAAITYAFSLHVLGRSAEGIEIVKKLPVEGLRDPHAAVYAAVLLLRENQSAAAREYIHFAEAGPIFPEEKKLLNEAIARATASTPSASSSPSP